MPKPKPTRLYLRTKQSEYHGLMWFQNNKPNEMLIGLYSLGGDSPSLRFIWPERELNSDQLSHVRYNYDDMVEVDYQVDHITCHADGTFHIKTKDQRPIYIQSMKRVEPLGPNTGQFLDMTILSDLVQHYSVFTEPAKLPHVWMDLQENHYLSLRGMFSGVNYKIENDLVATMSQFAGMAGGITLTSGTLKGMLLGQSSQMNEIAQQHRPRGTILTFNFPVGEDRWHIKSFLFQ